MVNCKMSSLGRISLQQTQVYFQTLFVSHPLSRLIVCVPYLVGLSKNTSEIFISKALKSSNAPTSFTSNEKIKKTTSSPKSIRKSKILESKATTNTLSDHFSIKNKRKFTHEEDKLIVQAVKSNDDQRKTFVNVTKVSSISDPLDLQKRSRKNLVNKKVKKIYPLPAEEQRTKNKKFSPEDDDLILNHTNQYGKGEISIIELAESRNRGSVQSVRNRVNQSIINFPEKQVLSREKTIISAHDPGPLSQSFEIQIPKENFVKQTRKRKFSSKEDTIILNHLNTFGGGQDSVIRLAEALGRSSLEGLRKRIHQLTSNQSKEEISNKDQRVAVFYVRITRWLRVEIPTLASKAFELKVGSVLVKSRVAP